MATRGALALREGPLPMRPVVWALHMALPLLGLWLLIEQPSTDVVWEDHPAHFWLVVAVAAVNVGLAARVGAAAGGRDDARLFLISLSFLASAGFLGLHALATPGVLLDAPNAGFVIATPVGLLLAGALALASSLELGSARSAALLRRRRLVLGAVYALLAAWAAVSLLEVPPLDTPLDADEAAGELEALAIAGVPLYGLAALRYYLVHRRRPAVLLLGVITAFVLLAEALVAVALARNWHLSWWEWHLLLAAAYGFVAYSANVAERREGSPTGLFNSISLEETVRRVRTEHGAALDELVGAMRRGDAATGRLAARVADRFDLSEGQAAVLERAGEALVHEREQIERLGALVAVGREARVILSEEELLERAYRHARGAFPGLRLGLVRDGVLVWPDALGGPPPRGATEVPLEVKGRRAGAVVVAGELAERDRSLLDSFASQLSIGLENARLYSQIDALFRQYMSADVATALLADPGQAALGGAVADVTLLFADLRGFTELSERATPTEVVELLNERFGAAVPLVLAEGGTVIEFVGDALVALFGAPVRHADHARRAARAALAIQQAVGEAPRFRIGLNSGEALIGNIGSEERRNYTAIGDTVNLAARLEGEAQPGQVVIGAATRAALDEAAAVQPLGPLRVKGKAEPVEAFILNSL